MATLYISEFNKSGKSLEGAQIDAATLPAIVHQTVAVGGASVQSAAFAGSYVRLVSDTACYVSVGTNPTASASTMRLLADSPEYFAVTPGHKIAVIQG